MQIHDEEEEDGGQTCQQCSYQTTSRDQLIEHMGRTHKQNNLRFKCEICLINFNNQREINTHNKKRHNKYYKPCQNFATNNCEYDNECHFHHVILNQGEHICYKCGEICNNKTLLMRHIASHHGEEQCKKFAAGRCNFGDRCLFKHTNISVRNVPNSQNNEAPQIFQYTPTTGQQLMVGQEERIMLQTMNQLMNQMMRKMNLQ